MLPRINANAAHKLSTKATRKPIACPVVVPKIPNVTKLCNVNVFSAHCLNTSRSLSPIRGSRMVHLLDSLTFEPGNVIKRYLHATRLSCDAMSCHLSPRFSQVSVQTWQTFRFG